MLIGRLFKLQIIDYEFYQGKVIANIERETTLTAERGMIYDRNMTVLATNYTVWRIFLSPKDVTDASQASLIATGLGEILGLDPENILSDLNKYKNKADRTVAKAATEEQADAVRKFIVDNELQMQVHLESSTKRYYPFSSLASNVIGIMGTDSGLIGLELQYDSFLAGESGKYITAKNASGLSMPYKYDTYIDASNGANLVSTIDVTIQKALEKQLEQTYDDSMPQNRVTGIVMDCNTGAILGMATYPNFDLNDPYTLDEDSLKKLAESGYEPGTSEYSSLYTTLLYSLWKNKAVSELYEPGSTQKIITTSMALEEGLVTWNDKFNCTGSHHVEGYAKPIHCWKLAGHGTHPFWYMLQNSCNPTLMTIAARVGKNTFYKYFQEFGYTEKTGIDLPGEASPIYSSLSNFNNVELAVYSFGQTFKVTPLQQITAISAIANGGYLVTPYVVDQIVDDDGNILMQHETQIKRQVISTENCKSISEVLEDGVSGNGGAKNAYVAGYKIAAKTGTSEVRDILNENGESYLRVGSCVAYAPADDPQIAMIIVVDQPQCASVYGSVIAAPYIANLMDEILPYIGIERSYTEEELKKLTVNLRNYVGWTLSDATKSLNNLGISFEVKGNGDIVNYQIPGANENIIKSDGKIILYTGNETPVYDISVPNLIGLNASSANKAVANKRLNIVLEGSTIESSTSDAYVVEQFPAAGTLVTYGSVVTVTLRYMDDGAN